MEFSGTAEYTVLQDMCHTCAVLRRCAECDIKYFILIIILDQHNSCTCFSYGAEASLWNGYLSGFSSVTTS